MTHERRRSPRAVVLGTATVLTDAGPKGPYILENLSAGGALLSGAEGFAVGTSVRLLLRLSGATYRLEGVVVRQHPLGGRETLAIAFQRTPAPVEQTIHGLVVAQLERQHEATAVVIVDSCRGHMTAFERDLRSLGRAATLFATAPEATAFLDNPRIAFDIALVEIGDASAELFPRLSRDFPRVRRIGTYAGTEPLTIGACTDARLAKPWTLATLTRAMTGLL